MRTKTRWICALAAVGLLALGAAPAAADHVRGIRVTPTAINPGTMSVTVDVTMTQGELNAMEINTSVMTADIDWGDGSSSLAITLPNVSTFPTGETEPAGRYRASFMHVYPDLALRTITVDNVGYECCAPATDDTDATVYTGNRYTATSEGDYLSNTAVINFAAAPSLPSYGLLVLALVLSALGVLLLRRDPNVAI